MNGAARARRAWVRAFLRGGSFGELGRWGGGGAWGGGVRGGRCGVGEGEGSLGGGLVVVRWLFEGLVFGGLLIKRG